MKNIFKKNQIIITALAALIAVAGYLNHVESANKDNAKEVNQNETGTYGDDIQAADNTDIDSNDVDITGEPGEAVLVNATGTVDFIVEAKMQREQTRANSKSMLMEVVNNAAITDEEKTAAVNKMVSLADVSEREAAAENLIAAKGFSNVVVTVTDEKVDVMIVSEVLTDAQRAQIEEIVKTKTNVSADKITITAVKTKK